MLPQFKKSAAREESEAVPGPCPSCLWVLGGSMENRLEAINRRAPPFTGGCASALFPGLTPLGTIAFQWSCVVWHSCAPDPNTHGAWGL